MLPFSVLIRLLILPSIVDAQNSKWGQFSSDVPCRMIVWQSCLVQMTDVMG